MEVKRNMKKLQLQGVILIITAMLSESLPYTI